jgi:tRNA(fMet)-specific endonuclease VapC
MRPLENVAALKGFFEAFAIIEFNESDAFIYGKVRAKLEKAGKVIGAMDMLIASQALNRKLICVTNNEREFRRVEGLSVENWVK